MVSKPADPEAFLCLKPTPRSDQHRPSGVRSLPPVAPNGLDDGWLERAFLTVERAFDRWAWAQERAVRAARGRAYVLQAVACVTVAWSNYWRLIEELDRLRRSTDDPGLAS